jgi:hypothetical protein
MATQFSLGLTVGDRADDGPRCKKTPSIVREGCYLCDNLFIPFDTRA